ncbi:FAD-dependent oxidoreductase [Puniceicoccus vermicola]|uniref:FAD-dependent oxidoreductase n=1 Tax=Puniceicoccus vermicola TaxID=388746 RepID=A0A7X1E5J8_9BACT|nr:FAD-dependent oxidoreductase [Puniceicoccus vermicola]MBC2603214.1 FAD-dependent oxidoreductase [Puniceicoccus vermicola]
MTPTPEHIEVLVVGGGTAGTIAAIQSAKAGAKTSLIERGSQLGGVTTTGGVNFPGLFHAWGKQIISGIGWDLVRRTALLEDRELPDFSTIPERHWHHQIRINGSLYAALAEESCLEAGVDLCFYEFVSSIEAVDGGWKVKSVGPGIERIIHCKVLIDCTGGADVVGMAGFPRLRDPLETQPGTLMFEFGGYEVSALNGDAIQRQYENALNTGALKAGDFATKSGRFISFLQKGGENAQHVFGADGSTSVSQTKANIEGRRSMLRLLRFRTLPGCENARLLRAQQETAVRETWRIEGEYSITQSDYCTGRQFADSVCYSFYPIDLHTAEGVKPVPLEEGVVARIPLRALIPKYSHGLLVAGRSVASDRMANSALRVQASAMAMGQAAGACAALAAQGDVTPGAVKLSELHHLLRSHQAVVPSPA